MSSTTAPTKRSNACVPCHQRKVRCDASVRGIPCSRCISKGRIQICTLLPPRRHRRPAKQDHNQVHDHRHDCDTSRQMMFGSDQDRIEESSFRASIDDPQTQHWRVSTSPRSMTSTAIVAETSAGVSEEDAQLHTLQLMAHRNDLSASIAEPNGSPEVIEYFDKLNSISILSEALGQPQQRRLIRLGVNNSSAPSAKQRETSGLEPSEITYLESKGVFEDPHNLSWLLCLWFEHVYPYTPVLDPAKFFEDYERGTCSHFLLFALIANVAHYASSNDLLSIGYSDRYAAQRDCVRKAQLLYDFGCEKHQLTMLQGSLILSSIQASFAPIKDFRYWFHNAVRIAAQMGLHRQNLGDDLDPSTYKLCRRIWWVIYTRDVLFNLSGFVNARCINEGEVDVDHLSEDDWNDASLCHGEERAIPSSTKLHRCFFIQKCRLACKEAEFIRLTREHKTFVTLSTAKLFTQELNAWRSALPEILQPSCITIWSKENVWIIILMTHAYRLECVFVRAARDRFRQSNDDAGLSWCKQQLLNCVFELDTFVGRAIMNNLARFAPGSFIVCACNLLAFHIEIALDHASSPSQKITAKSRIHVILTYLRDVGDSWRMARWTFRVSEWVVKRAGLMLRADMDNADIYEGSNNNDAIGNARFDSSAFGSDATLPEHWIQDLLGQNFFGQLHDELFNFGQG